MNVFKKVLSILLVALSVALLCSTNVQSKDSVEWYDESDETFSNFISIKPIEQIPKDKLIDNFDVRSDGVVAIVFSDWKHIAIIDNNGGFLYGFEVDLSVNGGFYVVWDNDTLNILTNRGDRIFAVDDEGTILKSGKLTSSNWISEAETRKRKVNGDTYEMSSSIAFILSTGYSRLTKTTADGEITEIYSNSTKSAVKSVSAFLIISLVVAVSVSFICFNAFKQYKKHRNSAKAIR